MNSLILALTVVAGCDIAIAAEDALFGLPEVNFGHFPAGDTPRSY